MIDSVAVYTDQSLMFFCCCKHLGFTGDGVLEMSIINCSGSYNQRQLSWKYMKHEAYYTTFWPSPGLKKKTFDNWILIRQDLNFCGHCAPPGHWLLEKRRHSNSVICILTCTEGREAHFESWWHWHWLLRCWHWTAWHVMWWPEGLRDNKHVLQVLAWKQGQYLSDIITPEAPWRQKWPEPCKPLLLNGFCLKQTSFLKTGFVKQAEEIKSWQNCALGWDWGGGLVARASDRHVTDAGSIPPCGEQGSPFFIMLGGGLDPVLQFKRVFSPLSENFKGYLLKKKRSTSNTHTYTVETENLYSL